MAAPEDILVDNLKEAFSVEYPFVEDRVGRILIVDGRASPYEWPDEWPDGRCSGGSADTRSYQHLP
jgi:hypothetical protein